MIILHSINSNISEIVKISKNLNKNLNQVKTNQINLFIFLIFYLLSFYIYCLLILLKFF